ncbi:hypothetical protein UF75_1457 [Desulfosporosinus sp. I2]|nr:hypothetical protein UF75_1457 [Desulfosporosinus sp. I2]
MEIVQNAGYKSQRITQYITSKQAYIIHADLYAKTSILRLSQM